MQPRLYRAQEAMPAPRAQSDPALPAPICSLILAVRVQAAASGRGTVLTEAKEEYDTEEAQVPSPLFASSRRRLRFIALSASGSSPVRPS